MENIFTKKQFYFIGFSSLIISLLGLLDSAKTYFYVKSINVGGEFEPIPMFYWVTKPLYLMFGFKKTAFDVYEVFALLMLFIGGILFFIKKGRETRLISFVFSLIFICNFSLFFNYLFMLYRKVKRVVGEGEIEYHSFLVIATILIYIALSFYILKLIKKTKILDVTTTETKVSIKDTPKSQRLIHFLIDTFVMLLVFFPLLESLWKTFASSDFERSFYNTRFSLWVLLFVCRFIFYPLFEIVFGATPAKFLTESRVINYLGEKANASTLITRTLCRSIPFNPVSFLWKTGWHDAFSNTHVVKEKRTGFKTSYLLIALIVFIPYIIFYYYGEDLMSEWRRSEEYKLSKNVTYSFNENSIKNINSDQAYALSQLGYGDDYQVVILKVEKVDGDRVICKKIIHPETYTTSYYSVMDYYQKQKDTAEVFTLKKQDFFNAAPRNLGEDDDNRRNATEFFRDGKRYEIMNIYTLSSPILEEPNYWSAEEYKEKGLGLMLRNIGKSGKILSVKNLEGNVKWNDRFPLEIKNSKIEALIYLKADNVKPDEEFSVEILVEDSIKNTQLYRVDKVRDQYTSFNVYQLK